MSGIMPPPEVRTEIITVLFTDIERSTRMWDHDQEEMTKAFHHHFQLIGAAVAEAGGTVTQDRGDGLVAVFEEPVDAVVAAATAQRSLAGAEPTLGGRLQARMGVHTGECRVFAGRHYGQALSCCARLHAVAHGGQVLLSEPVSRQVRQQLPEELGLCHLGEFWLRDFADSHQIYQLTGPGMTDDFPPINTRTAAANELPPVATSFVGRAEEMAALAKLVVAHREPVVSLIGGAGLGKTRLARQLASEIWHRFRDGVVWLEVSVDDTFETMVSSIADRLGIHLRSDGDEPELSRKLASAELLVIVDNAESSIRAARRLVELLNEYSPLVQVVATSREPLRVAGELRWSVAPLATGEEIDLEPQGAVQLFEDRARSVRPDLTIDFAERARIHQIVSNLDGHPLAIEQAAAALDQLSLEELAAGARRHPDATPLPGEIPRELADSIGRSLERLSSEEVGLLRQLPIFRGGITSQAVSDVVIDPIAGDETKARQLLAGLARASLLQSNVGTHSTTYRLLQPIRDYLAHGSAPPAELLARRDEYFLRLALEESRSYRDGDQTVPVERLSNGWPDIRASVMAAIANEAHEQAGQVIVSLYDFCLFTLRTEMYHWAAETEQHVQDVELRAQLGGIHALGAWSRGDMARAVELAEAALALGASPSAEIMANRTAMNALAYQGRMDLAAGHFFAVIDGCRFSETAYLRIDGVVSEAVGHAVLGDYVKAERLARSAVEAAERFGNQNCLYWAYYGLGLALAREHPVSARAAFRRALDEAEAIGSSWNCMNGGIELLGLSRRHDDFDIVSAQRAWELIGRLALAGTTAQLAQLTIEICWLMAKAGQQEEAAEIYCAVRNKPRMPRPDSHELDAQLETVLGFDPDIEPGEVFLSDEKVVERCRQGLLLLLGAEHS